MVILTGAGETFSAGGDIPMMQKRIDDPELFNRKNLEMKQMIFGLLDLEKPVIARINGDCIGLGATLALMCDIMIAVDTARFCDPHVKMGYVAGDGGAVIWPQLIGYAKAKEYLLTGDMLDAVEAERIGLINHAVPRDQLDAKVNTLAEKLARGSNKAIKWTKTSMNIPLRQLAHSMMDASLAYEALTNIGPDHQEAVTAFQEKRKPDFRGAVTDNCHPVFLSIEFRELFSRACVFCAQRIFGRIIMGGIIYLVGLVVVIMALLSFFGIR